MLREWGRLIQILKSKNHHSVCLLGQEIKCFSDYRVKPAGAVGTNELIYSNNAKFMKIILFTPNMIVHCRVTSFIKIYFMRFSQFRSLLLCGIYYEVTLNNQTIDFFKYSVTGFLSLSLVF